MGNINRQSLREIWNGEPYRSLRHDIVHSCHPGHPCYACLYYRTSGENHPPFQKPEPLIENSDSGKNTLLAEQEYNQRLETLQSMPTVITMVSSTACNIRCTFCNQYTQHLEKQSLSSSAITDILSNVRYSHTLSWLGGECFMDPQCRKFLNTFKREFNPNLGFVTATNGVMANERVLSTLLSEFRNYYILFSIESFDSAEYSALQKHSHYDIVIANLKRFRDATRFPSKLEINACMMKSTIRRLPRLLKGSVELGVTMKLSPVLVWPPTEVIDIFSNFEKETQGWPKALEESLAYCRQKISEGHENFQSGQPLNPEGTLSVLTDLYARMKVRYTDCYKVKVNYLTGSDFQFAEEIVLSSFQAEQGYCFISPAGILPKISNLDCMLFENDRDLGPKVAAHDLIRDEGKGRFSILRDHENRSYVYFSTSDGSDPSRNGRRYILKYFIATEKDPLGRRRQPVLIAAQKDNISRPVGYVVLSDPGIYEMDIPREIDLESLVYYTLLDVLDKRDRCCVNQVIYSNLKMPEVVVVRIPIEKDKRKDMPVTDLSHPTIQEMTYYA
jgi:sulfatase maturation enzyme AslB (radical SAM superfamily)